MEHFTITVGVALAMCAFAVQQETVDSDSTLEPDSRVQELLYNLVPPLNSGTKFMEALDTLRKVPLDKLTPQLVIFGIQADGTEEAMVPAIVVWQLKISPEAIARILGPQVGSANQRLNKEIDNWLDGAESQNRKGPPNYEGYIQVLMQRRTAGESLPLALVERMYSVDPRHALTAMIRVFQLGSDEAKSLILSDHRVFEVLWRRIHMFDVDEDTISMAKDALARLAQHEQWWVRLYVAEILRQHSNLRTDNVVRQLQQDEHELVRQAANATRDSI